MRLRNEKTDPKLFKHILDEQGYRINKKNKPPEKNITLWYIIFLLILLIYLFFRSNLIIIDF